VSKSAAICACGKAISESGLRIPIGKRGAASGGGRPQARATGADGAQALRESGPGPRLELLVARFVLASRRLEILEPGVGLLDLKQFLCELRLGHLDLQRS
jgi:hypothetical protein